MARRIQALGICRWSYPAAPGAFNTGSSEGLEGIRRAMYDPVRIALRLFYLEHIVLPPLRNQTDQDFEVILLMGDQLPEVPRRRVLELIDDIPQIKPVFAEEGRKHKDICRELMTAARDPEVRAVAEFKIDDDDAVALDFVERTRLMFDGAKGLFRDGGRLGVDFNRGFVLQTEATGIKVRYVSARAWSPGYVLFVRPRAKLCLLDYDQTRLWRRITTISYPKAPMFIRGVHGSNDSDIPVALQNVNEAWIDPQETCELLEERFGFNLPMIEQEWLSLIGGK